MKFFNKNFFNMNFWRKNKVVILATIIILISVLYWGIDKAIDKYEISRGDLYENDSDGVRGGDVECKSDDNVTESEETKDDSNFFSDENIGEDSVIGEDDMSTGDNSFDENDKEAGNNASSWKNIDESGKIYVYITGEVNNAGVVILNEGSRISDAIDAAGGITSKANISKVNLVYVLEDGMKVNIPNDNDLKNNPDFEYVTMSSGDGKNDVLSGVMSSSTSNSNTYSNNSSSSHTPSIVNINTATQTELETLPGIGPSTALKIINYRKENGKFSSIEDIKNVSGIGDAKFENIKNYITV